MNPTPNPSEISPLEHPSLQDSPYLAQTQVSSVGTALAFKRVRVSRAGFEDYCDSLYSFLEPTSRTTRSNIAPLRIIACEFLKVALSCREETPTQYDESIHKLYYIGGGAFQLIKYNGDFRSALIHSVDKGILEIPFEVLSNVGTDPRPHPQQDGTHDRMQSALEDILKRDTNRLLAYSQLQ
jgi:hypothetical protein